MRRAFMIVAGFLHDFSTGLWAACLLVTWWLHRALGDQAIDAVLRPVLHQLFFVGLGCTVVVLLTGAGRSFTYVENVYGSDSEQLRRRMLLIKHVILLGIFGAGTWIQYRLAFG
ncbi:MAG: hypothetical protein C0404_01415 [Verrucomicrobia bacterium]|nr:hypothetical protein [Verrucomicrobiota bacterium]